ncbi:Uncharacterised protein [Citrobacter youngae]|uniref:Uncharacterized protein n=1 Tax=Citrobacter youngae TaxID=133448 RepID=A0A9Q7ZPT3_9ENTR|nr:hypothetical protein [Citrobacter youngae]SUX81649.1 Uncharacterised protein [Citrobacter youngae]
MSNPSVYISQENMISGVVFNVDYERSMKMRLELAISSIQRFSALAEFDAQASNRLAKWSEYYSAINPEMMNGNYEGAYKIELPVDR